MKQQKLAIEKVKIINWPTSSVFCVGETLRSTARDREIAWDSRLKVRRHQRTRYSAEVV